jgi:hypothetical protein
VSDHEIECNIGCNTQTVYERVSLVTCVTTQTVYERVSLVTCVTTQTVYERVSKRGDIARDHLYFWHDPPADVLVGNSALRDDGVLSALQRLQVGAVEGEGGRKKRREGGGCCR